MKNIKELSQEEAKQILEFVFPNQKYYTYKGISFEPTFNEEGLQELTFGLRSRIGIKYHNGQDNCILHFNNTKVVLWLYKNGYNITNLLETNKYLTDMELDFEELSFYIEYYSTEGSNIFKEWNLESFCTMLKKLLDKYYYKDYE